MINKKTSKIIEKRLKETPFERIMREGETRKKISKIRKEYFDKK